MDKLPVELLHMILEYIAEDKETAQISIIEILCSIASTCKMMYYVTAPYFERSANTVRLTTGERSQKLLAATDNYPLLRQSVRHVLFTKETGRPLADTCLSSTIKFLVEALPRADEVAWVQYRRKYLIAHHYSRSSINKEGIRPIQAFRTYISSIEDLKMSFLDLKSMRCLDEIRVSVFLNPKERPTPTATIAEWLRTILGKCPLLQKLVINVHISDVGSVGEHLVALDFAFLLVKDDRIMPLLTHCMPSLPEMLKLFQEQWESRVTARQTLHTE